MTQQAAVRTSLPRTARLDDGRTTSRGHLEDPHFLAAVREMEALGLRVTSQPHPDSIPFDVLGGRAHLRWFLVPARPRPVRAASLALIRPLRPAARILKHAMAGAIRLGLPLWRHGRVHVSGMQNAARGFDPGISRAAFLTGTAGPHRKLTVQWMDARGGIRAYAKVSCTPAVQALLANEGSMLEQLHAIGLHSAAVPRVLLRGLRHGTAVLATDTVGTPRHPCCTRLHAAHMVFLDELAARTASPRVPHGDELLHGLRAQVTSLHAGLPVEWRQRFDRTLQGLAFAPGLLAPRGLAHGDFTPVNTFRHQGRLFVFDWEYAGYAYPADYDLIHFLFAARRTRRAHPVDDCAAIESMLIRDLGRSPAAARARIAAYLCTQALLLAGRRSRQDGERLTWEGEAAGASMLDALREHGRIPR